MKNSQKTLALAVGSAFALTMATASVSAAENPFEATTLSSGYQVAEHGKEGEGKCGTGKCGAEKAKEGACGEKGKEGKCGAEKAKDGKCGTGKCGAEKAKSKAKDGKCGTGKCGNTH